ncbi:MAG: holo-ACP synthase [Candidatus Izemoplasmatales bacterium]|jgi:holo-[acyl-carrier protein] synthase|nr:holo-ACP synthase [Candidatus Izemoplasmatales bacterium]
MIKGIGTDIVENIRVNQSLARRVLSDNELKAFEQLKLEQRKQEFLCGRFAAKEAIIKACSQANIEVFMRDITILNDQLNRPFVANPKFESYQILVSISHEKDYSIAFAIIESLE